MFIFLMRNEIISEDIQKCQNILLFTLHILHSSLIIISDVTKGLSQGGKLRKMGPTGYCTGSTSQHSEKNLRNEDESGCGWLN